MGFTIETTELPEESLKQYINARQAFLAYQSALVAQKEYRGNMLWREQAGHIYLIRDSKAHQRRASGASCYKVNF